MTNPWNASLFGCLDDVGTCLYGILCIPCLFGSNAEKIDDSNCVLMCCAYGCTISCYLCWLPHCLKREALRKKFNLKTEPCDDVLVACCCGPCGLCQEAREIKFRAQIPNAGYMSHHNIPVMHQPFPYGYHHQMGYGGQV